jgi:hypothetical protein
MRSLSCCASGLASYVMFHAVPYNLWGSVTERDVKNEGLMTAHANATVRPFLILFSIWTL